MQLLWSTFTIVMWHAATMLLFKMLLVWNIVYKKFNLCLNTLSSLSDHINHIVNVAGFDHVGIGSDFDGINLCVIILNQTLTFYFLVCAQGTNWIEWRLLLSQPFHAAGRGHRMDRGEFAQIGRRKFDQSFRRRRGGILNSQAMII